MKNFSVAISAAILIAIAPTVWAATQTSIQQLNPFDDSVELLCDRVNLNKTPRMRVTEDGCIRIDPKKADYTPMPIPEGDNPICSDRVPRNPECDRIRILPVPTAPDEMTWLEPRVQ